MRIHLNPSRSASRPGPSKTGQKNAGHRDERRDGLLFPPEQENVISTRRESQVFFAFLPLPISNAESTDLAKALTSDTEFSPNNRRENHREDRRAQASILMKRYGS